MNVIVKDNHMRSFTTTSPRPDGERGRVGLDGGGRFVRTADAGADVGAVEATKESEDEDERQ